MSRLIFVPQYPAKMRYQEWWFYEFPNQLKNYFDEIIVLGKDYFLNEKATRGESENFSPIDANISFECAQINEYLNLKLRSNDILFLADVSFPGVFSSVLYHKPCSKMFVFCHATSANYLDYFEQLRPSKFQVETGHSMLFNKVFCGSQYSADKVGWKNTKVVALPSPPVDIINQFPYVKKVHNIVSVCRPSPQKTNSIYEDAVEKEFGKIERQLFDNWNCYSKFLSASKILLITTKEDTFNYTIMDAIRCGCVPLAPRNLCFPEILHNDYLFDTVDELIKKIEDVLNGELKVPDKMVCQDKVDNFYANLAKIMKGK